MGIRRGTFQGGPLSTLLSDLMVEPLIRWLKASSKGYDIASCDLKMASKRYADDGILITSSVEDMISLLEIISNLARDQASILMLPNVRSRLTSTNYNLPLQTGP